MQTSAAWRGLEWYLLARACACLMPPWTLLARGRVIPDCVLTTRSAPRISSRLGSVDSLNAAVHDSQFDLVFVFSHLLRTLRAQEEISSCTSDVSCEAVDQ